MHYVNQYTYISNERCIIQCIRDVVPSQYICLCNTYMERMVLKCLYGSIADNVSVQGIPKF